MLVERVLPGARDEATSLGPALVTSVPPAVLPVAVHHVALVVVPVLVTVNGTTTTTWSRPCCGSDFPDLLVPRAEQPPQALLLVAPGELARSALEAVRR
jgi:hypothetical protein